MTTPCRDEREHTEDHRKRIHERADETPRNGLLLFARHGVDAELRPFVLKRGGIIGFRPFKSHDQTLAIFLLFSCCVKSQRRLPQTLHNV